MDDSIKLALETIAQNKQAIVFCASRASAEKTAEEIARKRIIQNIEEKELAEDISQSALSAISPATKQCKRLAGSLKKQIAFHHSGLASKQKEIVETEFKKGNIKIICATPTLAAGLSLPVFRVIIKSLKRFTGRFGMSWIPTLEYLQMAGRAGRPEYEDFGEAIAIAKNEGEKEEIYTRYICGKPEEIYSKLNVEPVLRMYVLSLIASGLIKDTRQLREFFSKTFWAHQFGDLDELNQIVDRIIQLLSKWGFILNGDKQSFDSKESSEPKSLFTSALDLVSKKANTKCSNRSKEPISLKATKLGRRVSELYLDPLTANELITRLRNAQEKISTQQGQNTLTEFSYLQAISNTLELMPLLRIKSKEQDEYQNILLANYDSLLQKEPDVFDLDYSDFMDSIKTADFFLRWINETTEDQLLTEMNVRPGEIRVKLDNADWLLYSCYELSKVLNFKEQQPFLQNLRTRVKFGVRKELLPLMKIKGVGRNRSRKLFDNKFQSIVDLKNADQSALATLLGPKMAASIKEQLGQEVKPIKKNSRKGQLSLTKF